MRSCGFEAVFVVGVVVLREWEMVRSRVEGVSFEDGVLVPLVRVG